MNRSSKVVGYESGTQSAEKLRNSDHTALTQLPQIPFAYRLSHCTSYSKLISANTSVSKITLSSCGLKHLSPHSSNALTWRKVPDVKPEGVVSGYISNDQEERPQGRSCHLSSVYIVCSSICGLNMFVCVTCGDKHRSVVFINIIHLFTGTAEAFGWRCWIFAPIFSVEWHVILKSWIALFSLTLYFFTHQILIVFFSFLS